MRKLIKLFIPKKIRRRIHALNFQIEEIWALSRGIRAISLYMKFLKELKKYRKLPGEEDVSALNLWPFLFDNTEVTPIPVHYFYQAAWAARRIIQTKPKFHVDVGSQLDLIGILSASIPVTFMDIRPLSVSLSNVNCIAGSVLDIPFPDNSIPSLSCLHVIEHIGLGRYGDPLDLEGTRKAAKELVRILAHEGNLFLSLPIGRERVCFNAHRIHAPETIINYFKGLNLIEFSGETDTGKFLDNIDPFDFNNKSYSCGFFWFRKRI